MKILTIFLLFPILILIISCDDDKWEPVPTPNNFEQVFTSFWDQMNRSYVYWDVDSTDWGETYNRYHKIFSQLNLDSDEDVSLSVGYFREMTEHIMDGHYFINFKHPAIMDSVVYPLTRKKEKLGLIGEEYPYLLMDTIYLDKKYVVGYDAQNTLNSQALVTVCGTVDKTILYFSCNFFKLSQSYYSNSSESVTSTLNFFFNWIKQSTGESRGVIIDVRNNPGGDLADLNFLLGRLTENPLHFGYCQYKNGDGALDLTPRVKAYVNPEPEAKNIELPIVILTDTYTASLSELMTIAVKSFPKGLSIGETTWGSTSPVVPFEVYSSGSFEVQDFMSVQLSSCKFTPLDGKVYEGIGFAPDILIPHSARAYTSGKDPQLERAIEFLR